MQYSITPWGHFYAYGFNISNKDLNLTSTIYDVPPFELFVILYEIRVRSVCRIDEVYLCANMKTNFHSEKPQLYSTKCVSFKVKSLDSLA